MELKASMKETIAKHYIRRVRVPLIRKKRQVIRELESSKIISQLIVLKPKDENQEKMMSLIYMIFGTNVIDNKKPIKLFDAA